MTTFLALCLYACGGGGGGGGTPTTVNQAPIVTVGVDLSVDASSTVTLSGSATDDDGTITNYLWIQTGGESVALTNADTSTATFTAPATAQILTFVLTATDDRGVTATDTVDIDVSEFYLKHNHGQVNQFEPGTEIEWTLNGYDPEVHTLTWSIDSTAPVILSDRNLIPNKVSFTTLLVANDTEVTLNVAVKINETTSTFHHTITMLASTGLGFSAAELSTNSVALTDATQFTATPDLTGDGYPELLSVQDGQLSLLINKGTQQGLTNDPYQPSILISTENPVADWLFGDMNNDNLPDILLISSARNKLSWLANTQDAERFKTETPLAFTNEVQFISAQLVDLDADGDGDLDIVTTFHEMDSDFKLALILAWFEQTSASNFAAIAIIDSQVDGSYFIGNKPQITTGDFLCDIGCDDHKHYAGIIHWFENTGTNIATSAKTLAYSNSASAFTLTDIDNDGDLDIINTDKPLGATWIYQNNVNP